MDTILDLIAGDQSLISYRPKLRKITDSITATILLQQMLYRWKKQNSKPFYKFKEPCNHPKYKKGDSWTEELSFSAKEFDSALKKIGYKMGKSDTFKEIKKEDAFIIFRTDKQRLTWYEINEKAATQAINRIYSVTDDLSVTRYITNDKVADNLQKVSYSSSTENTTETTTERKKIYKRKKSKNPKNGDNGDKGLKKPIKSNKPILPKEPIKVFKEYFPKEYLIKDNLFAIKNFVEMRNENKKPLTERAIKMICTECVKYTPEETRKAFSQSIINSYQGVFPKKEFTFKGYKGGNGGNSRNNIPPSQRAQNDYSDKIGDVIDENGVRHRNVRLRDFE